MSMPAEQVRPATFGLRRQGRIHLVACEETVRRHATDKDEIVRATTTGDRVSWDMVRP